MGLIFGLDFLERTIRNRNEDNNDCNRNKNKNNNDWSKNVKDYTFINRVLMYTHIQLL